MEKILELIEQIGLPLKESADSFISISEEAKNKIVNNINLVRLVNEEANKVFSFISNDLQNTRTELALVKEELRMTKEDRERIISSLDERVTSTSKDLQTLESEKVIAQTLMAKVSVELDSLLMKRSLAEDELVETIEELNEVKALRK